MWGLSFEDWISFGGLLVLAAILVNLGGIVKEQERADEESSPSSDLARRDEPPAPPR